MHIIIPVDHPQYQMIMGDVMARLAGVPPMTEAERARRAAGHANVMGAVERMRADAAKALANQHQTDMANRDRAMAAARAGREANRRILNGED